jgi:outer membrane protein assembly factor BamB
MKEHLAIENYTVFARMGQCLAVNLPQWKGTPLPMPMAAPLIQPFLSMSLFLMAIFCLHGGATAGGEGNWPSWRGEEGLGIVHEADLPTEWGREKNVLWRVELPERGNSTPIAWDHKVFLTQPVEGGKRRTLMCFDGRDGNLLWHKGVDYATPEETHATNPFCSPSPVTDGERVYAWFGSAGMVSFDLEGNLLWHRKLGPQDHMWGTGSSPILWKNLVIQNFGPGNNEFLIALDKATGDTVWKTPVPHEEEYRDRDRSELLHGSWSTPIVIDNEGREELILHWPHWMASYDPATGREIWRCGGLGDLAYAIPTWGEGVLVCMGGYHGPEIAIRPQGTGDLSENLLWREARSRLRLGAGVIFEGHLYCHDMQGLAECRELLTGKTLWRERLKGPGPTGESWSSLVLSGDRLYLPNQSGETFVFRASPEFELIAVNSLDEMTNSSLAVSKGRIFLRTHEALWCIGEK